MSESQEFIAVIRFRTKPKPDDEPSDAGDLKQLIRYLIEDYELTVDEVLVAEVAS